MNFKLSVQLVFRRLICTVLGHSLTEFEDFDTAIVNFNDLENSAILVRCKRSTAHVLSVMLEQLMRSQTQYYASITGLVKVRK